MTNAAALRKYIEWDVRNWAVATDFWLANSEKCLAECCVLEIGANYGGLSLWFAEHGAHVVCSDFQGVRKEAVELHRASGFSHLIEYETVDTLDITHREKFDIVVFKSVIGVVGDKALQKKAVDEMHKALKIGGELFFAENLAGSPIHSLFRRKMVEWGTIWRYVTIEEMNEFLVPFSEKRLRAIGFAGAFGRSEAQRNLLAIGDRLVFEKIVPERWKYIVAGVAKK